jgi:hypothetical protein
LLDVIEKKAKDTAKELNSIRPAYGFPGKMPAAFCFPAGTPVWCPGGARPIESLGAGDRVLTYDYFRGRLLPTAVQGVDVHGGDLDLLRIESPGAEPVLVTPGHWFFTGRRWLVSEELHQTGEVLGASGKAVPVATSAAGRFWAVAVYNLRTEFGTYLVGAPGLVASGVLAEQGDAPVEAALRANGCGRVEEELAWWAAELTVLRG